LTVWRRVTQHEYAEKVRESLHGRKRATRLEFDEFMPSESTLPLSGTDVGGRKARHLTFDNNSPTERMTYHYNPESEYNTVDLDVKRRKTIGERFDERRKTIGERLGQNIDRLSKYIPETQLERAIFGRNDATSSSGSEYTGSSEDESSETTEMEETALPRSKTSLDFNKSKPVERKTLAGIVTHIRNSIHKQDFNGKLDSILHPHARQPHKQQAQLRMSLASATVEPPPIQRNTLHMNYRAPNTSNMLTAGPVHELSEDSFSELETPLPRTTEFECSDMPAQRRTTTHHYNNIYEKIRSSVIGGKTRQSLANDFKLPERNSLARPNKTGVPVLDTTQPARRTIHRNQSYTSIEFETPTTIRKSLNSPRPATDGETNYESCVSKLPDEVTPRRDDVVETNYESCTSQPPATILDVDSVKAKKSVLSDFEDDFSQEVKDRLLEEYDKVKRKKNPYLTKKQRDLLTAETGLTDTQVRLWCNRARAKDRDDNSLRANESNLQMTSSPNSATSKNLLLQNRKESKASVAKVSKKVSGVTKAAKTMAKGAKGKSKKK